MKKCAGIFLLFLVSFFIINKSIAQGFPSTQDSIRILLCKKWQVDYILITGVKIAKGNNTPEIYFQFENDNSFVETSSDHKNKTTGKWVIDAEHKIIRLMQHEKNTMNILSLTPVELQLKVDAQPNDASDEMIMVFKPAQ